MENASDLPYLLAAMAVAVVVTAVMFFLLRACKAKRSVLKVGSASAFPALLVALIVYVEVWNPDPHGFVTVALSLLILLSLPVTILTTALLTRRFARFACTTRMPAFHPCWTFTGLGLSSGLSRR